MSKDKLQKINTPEKLARYSGGQTTTQNISQLLRTHGNYSAKEAARLIKDGRVFVSIRRGSRKLRENEELYVLADPPEKYELIDRFTDIELEQVMKKRRWIDVERARGYIVWDCPFSRCTEPEYLGQHCRVNFPTVYKCKKCWKKYKVMQVVGTRLLTEEQ